MAVDEIHVGDVGTVFTVTLEDDSIAVDISSATAKEIKLRGPSRRTVTKTATFVTDGTDGKLQATTEAGDIDQVGAWKVQARVVMGSGTWSSDRAAFTVHPNL